jgi:hypothetical protein
MLKKLEGTGLLARGQCVHSEGPATGHLDTGFLVFLCLKGKAEIVSKFHVATACFSCSPPPPPKDVGSSNEVPCAIGHQIIFRKYVIRH